MAVRRLLILLGGRIEAARGIFVTISAVFRNLTIADVDAMPAPLRMGNHWRFADGTTIPVVSGGDGTGDAPAGGPPPAAGAPPAADPPKTFTQADLDALRAQVANETKAAESQRIAADLGVSVVDAKKLITAQREAAEAAKTAEQQALDAAAERERKAGDREAAAAAKERLVDAKSALQSADVNSKHLARAATLLLSEAPADADEAAMTAAAAKLKAEMPELFTAARAPGNDPTGRGPAAGGNDGPTGVAGGRARAAADAKRIADQTKNPFEGHTLVGGSYGGNHS